MSIKGGGEWKFGDTKSSDLVGSPSMDQREGDRKGIRKRQNQARR